MHSPSFPKVLGDLRSTCPRAGGTCKEQNFKDPLSESQSSLESHFSSFLAAISLPVSQVGRPVSWHSEERLLGRMCPIKRGWVAIGHLQASTGPNIGSAVRLLASSAALSLAENEEDWWRMG